MKPKSLHDQIAHKCVHFNGISKSACLAGFVYDEVDKGMRLPYRVGLPCIKPDPEWPSELNGRPQCACPRLQFPTEAEVQSELDAHQKAMQKMMVALVAIDPIRKDQKGKNWRGMITCPVCQGKLHVTHAARNGHVHAKCETPDCVAWVE